MSMRAKHSNAIVLTLPSRQDDDFRFSLVTFNVLAPCYRQGERGAPSGSWWPWRRRSAPEPAVRWQARANDIAALLGNATSTASPVADIICLQEYFFHPTWQRIFQRALPDTAFECLTLKRAGKKEDGLAMWIHRARFRMQRWHAVQLPPRGDRVALLAHLVSASQPEHTFLVGNVHLTFPHTVMERHLRVEQARTLLRAVDAFICDAGAVPVFLCGDWNTLRPDDAVVQCLQQGGYRAARIEPTMLTHRTHRGDLVGCDMIFYRAPNCTLHIQEQLLPLHLSPYTWPAEQEYALSDHRPLRAAVRWRRAAADGAPESYRLTSRL
ncbi:hypothetical protein CDCA_CDCA03G1109 [Cyanidium caldarium]|uniref:Endonuclease/exonuclease/phosphatase domain-containing protein n=1 Tax=Cyanidium caldarium TaxID=2771 RepID=A0AAV9ISF7_CYACA|nr:hypothetical protein CDCA_CDCA03G1109 [Cyanidium caldarium]